MARAGGHERTRKNLVREFSWLYRNPNLEEQGEDGNDIPNILPDPDGPSGPRRMITIQAGLEDVFIPLYYGGPHEDGAIIVFADQHTFGPHKGKIVVMYLHGWGPLGLINNHRFETDKPYTSFGVELDVRTGLNNTVSPILQAIRPNCSAYPGLAYTVARFPINSLYPEVDPYSYRVSIPQGLLIRDSRVSLSTARNDLVYRDNVALCRFDLWTNKRYALGRDDSIIDIATVNEAADDCDVVLANGQKRFRLALKVDDNRGFEYWDQLIGQHAQMFTGQNAGKHQMFVDKVRAPSGLILTDTGTDHQIIGGTFRVKDASEVYNEISYEYVAQSNDWKTEKATTRHPGFDTGAVRELFEATYGTKGSPSFDQSKRLSIWGFNRAQLSDKEYFLDVLYDTGVQCVPGLIVQISCKDFDWASQLAIVRSVTRRGYGFRLKLEKYDANIYSDTPQTDQSIPAPNGIDPYAAVPDPINVSVAPVYLSALDTTLKTGVILKVEWSRPAEYQFYDRTRITLTRTKAGEATITEIFRELKDGPCNVPVAADGATYTVLLQTINSRNSLSAGVSTPVTPTVPSCEPPGLILGDRNNGWYFDLPPIRTPVVFPAANWSNLNLTTFVPSAIQDGNETVVSVVFGDATVDRKLTLDTGVGGTKIDEFVIVMTNSAYTDDRTVGQQFPYVEYSNSLAGPWSSFHTNSSLKDNQTGFTGKDRKKVHFTIDTAVVGSPRYWRFYQPFLIDPSATGFTYGISEIKCYAFDAVNKYGSVSGYLITRVNSLSNGVRNYETKRIDFQPTTSRRISSKDIEVNFKDDYYDLYGGYASQGTIQEAFIQTISTKEELSEARTLQSNIFLVGLPAGGSGLEQEYQPIQVYEADVTLATTNDLVFDNISGVLLLSTSTAGDKTITGLTKGYKGRSLIVYNSSSVLMYLAHESALSVVEHRFYFDNLMSRVMQPNQAIFLFYDPVADRWKNSVPMTHVGGIEDAQMRFFVSHVGSGPDARAVVRTSTQTAGLNHQSHPSTAVVSRWNKTLASWNELVCNLGSGLAIGTSLASPMILGTNALPALEIDTSQNVVLNKTAVTQGLQAPTFNGVQRTGLYVVPWTNAHVAALAGTSGAIDLCTVPAMTVVKNVWIKLSTQAALATSLDLAVSATGATYIVNCNAKALANTIYGGLAAERGAQLTGYHIPSATANTILKLVFTSGGTNLSAVTNCSGIVMIELELLG